ncbi:SH3 and cysteine-rich domain-containing protein 3, partial [Lates japonicus]
MDCISSSIMAATQPGHSETSAVAISESLYLEEQNLNRPNTMAHYDSLDDKDSVDIHDNPPLPDNVVKEEDNT